MVLERKVLGLKFKNPILPASGTFNMGREVAEFYELATFGGLITKGVTRAKRQGNVAPRTVETVGGMLNSVGLQNPGVDAFIKNDLPFMKKQGVPVIANACGTTIEDYVYVASQLDKSNVDAIELNISCPNLGKSCGGMSFGVDPEMTKEVVSAVRKVTKKPLIVKLTPNVTNIAVIAKAAESAGADAISLINTLAAMAVDIKTRKPILGNKVGGLSGPAVKPVALKMTWDVFNAVKIPVIGCGGISDYRDVIEFMLCGATLVQVGTGLLTDPMCVPKMVADLEKWCRENKINSLDEIVGGLKV
ncbi:MAG: dihydroorotate dehydrogenase [Firmicutes bacterium]|nr:dihydroorotate dehydrogenase [Bacillota bacterium]